MKNYNLLILVTLFTMFSCGDDSTAKNDPKKDVGLDTRDVSGDVKPKVDISTLDASTDQNTSDMPDVIDYGRTLKDYRTCKSDAQCPVGLGQCVKEVQLNRVDINGNDSVPISSIFEGLEADEGVCTRVCTISDTECSGLSANGATPDAEPYVCQIIVITDEPYPATPPAFPFDSTLNAQELEDGTPFGAICRPPFQLDDAVDRGLCSECVGGIACPGTAICWSALLGSEAGDGEAGTCFGRCSDAAPCPGGFTCDELGGQNYCRPILDSCTACVDRDKDGHGNGRCGTAADPVSDHDCDDFNPDAYFNAVNPDHAFPTFCAEANDFNCNGISDAAEEVGSINFGNDHCTACFDECRGAVPNGTSECIADTCRADCTDDTKWADCDGDLTNGCEQAVDDPTRVYYRDQDQDGFGDANDSIFACDPNVPPAGYVSDNTDCNDVEIDIFPGAQEVCNGIKENCDNATADENAIGIGDTCNNPGTIGACANGGVKACVNGGEVCEQVVMPTGETCNNIDDDCDGTTDVNLVTGPRWCNDSDGDSYGDCANPITACQSPGATYKTYSIDTNLWDCNDQNTDVHPFRTEDCSTPYDDDCDGLINDLDAGSKSNRVWFVIDPDGDGYGANGANRVRQCAAPVGYSTYLGSNDCEPNNANINPGETETCATPFDDNCNGDIDDAPDNETTPYYRDVDGDGYGVTLKRFCSISPPAGYAAASGDCNDNPGTLTVASNGHEYDGSDQNPGKGERCQGYDNNCNGTINDGCPLDYSFSNYRMQGDPVGSLIGIEVEAFCAAGEVLVGLTINSVDEVGSCATNGGVWGVKAQCANPRIAENDQDNPFSYGNNRGIINNSVLIGGQGPYLGPLCDHLRTSKNVRCEGFGRTVTGLEGSASSGGLHNLGITCKEKDFSDPTLINPTTVTMNSVWESGLLPGSYSAGSTFSNHCANNEVAVGIRAYLAGGRARSIELRCADISTLNQ